jgi:hypothetical protein
MAYLITFIATNTNTVQSLNKVNTRGHDFIETVVHLSVHNVTAYFMICSIVFISTTTHIWMKINSLQIDIIKWSTSIILYYTSLCTV